MFGNHHCQRCDKSITHAGICNDCEIARAMQFDLVPTGPAPKEERMETEFRSKTCGECAYFWSDSYTGTHCRRTGLAMTSNEIPACPSFVPAQPSSRAGG